MTTARDVMTADPRIVNVDDTAKQAADIFAKENLGAVVVCNDEQRLQGMITDRDIAVEVVAAGRDLNTKASELVDGREVVTIGADDSVDEAIATMKNHAVRRLPVIDGDKVIGMLSQADLARSVDDQQIGDLVEAISSAPDNTAQG